MGLDLYIEARIFEKKTGRLISSNPGEEFVDDEDKGFFEICWWDSWCFRDVRAKMIDIASKYAETNYTDSDFVIPIPQSALREIYACIINRSYLSDDEELEILSGNIDWKIRGVYERMNLKNAEKLHDLLRILNLIKYDNNSYIEKKYIPDTNDLKLLEENPQAYGWEFRILNSY